jgi:hypothetical protein
MQVLFKKKGTAVPAMAVENPKIAHFYIRRKPEILDTLISIFHMVSLPHILNDRCVKSLDVKLELPNSKRVFCFKCTCLMRLKSLKDKTLHIIITRQILDKDCHSHRIVKYSKCFRP